MHNLSFHQRVSQTALYIAPKTTAPPTAPTSPAIFKAGAAVGAAPLTSLLTMLLSALPILLQYCCWLEGRAVIQAGVVVAVASSFKRSEGLAVVSEGRAVWRTDIALVKAGCPIREEK